VYGNCWRVRDTNTERARTKPEAAKHHRDIARTIHVQ
jgi:hypothetical protein